MKWFLRMTVPLAMCIGPMLFPKASAMADYAEANLSTVSIQPGDLPSSFRLTTQCACIIANAAQQGLLNGNYRVFTNTEASSNSVIVQDVNMYDSSAQAHSLFVYLQAKAMRLVRTGPHSSNDGRIIRADHSLTLPVAAYEQGAYLDSARSGSKMGYSVLIYFHENQYAGIVVASSTVSWWPRTEAVVLIQRVVKRIQSNSYDSASISVSTVFPQPHSSTKVLPFAQHQQSETKVEGFNQCGEKRTSAVSSPGGNTPTSSDVVDEPTVGLLSRTNPKSKTLRRKPKSSCPRNRALLQE